MKQMQNVMGMPISVEIIGDAGLEIAMREVFDYFREVDEIFSTYKPTSQISRINSGEIKIRESSALVRKVLRECQNIQLLTDGYFDVERNGKIDPSGYVKGWAIHQASRMLERRLLTRYLIDAGGDIQASGEGPDGGPWAIGIANPFKPGKFAKMIYVRRMAIATSGIAERGTHIYNPITGEAVDDPVSLSVVGPTIDIVDAFATAAYCMGTKGLDFLHQQGLEAMLVSKNQEVILTQGFHRFESNSESLNLPCNSQAKRARA